MTTVTLSQPQSPWYLSPKFVNFGALVLLLCLVIISISVGVADFSWAKRL